MPTLDEKGYTSRSKWKRIEYEIDENGCWICVSHRPPDSKGYPRVTRNRQQIQLSHYSFFLANNRWPREDLYVLHSCDNPFCINPTHLHEGTPKENTWEMIDRGRKVVLKGTERPDSILTEKDVYEIKHLVKHKIYTHRKIANIYGVSKKTIGNISQGKNWIHVLI